jgi:outer membrane protein OmpA-like peptidoglycan-associated protein
MITENISRPMKKILLFFTFFCLNEQVFAQNALVKVNIWGKIPNADSVYFSLTPKDSLPSFQKIVVPNNPMILSVPIGKEYVCKVDERELDSYTENFSENINLQTAKTDDVFEVSFQFYAGSSDWDNINFLKNSLKTDIRSKEVLRIYQQFLEEYHLEYVELYGHADATEKNPKQLSLKRAEWVRSELIKAGINPLRIIQVKGFGKDNPTVPNKVEGKWDKGNMALNRRVQMRAMRVGTVINYVVNFPTVINSGATNVKAFQVVANGQQYYLGKNSFLVFQNKLLFELLKGYCYKFSYQTEKGEEKTWDLDLTGENLPNTVVEEINK